jgi:sporulation protein YlmC with PRC-barrel domain
MNPESSIKLVSQLLDLPLFDIEGRYCGIVDDIEFSGRAGQPLKLKALLVGPGAYDGRLPGWAMWIVRKIAGDKVTRVSMAKVRSIDAVVHLECSGPELKLHQAERSAARWIPHRGAL